MRTWLADARDAGLYFEVKFEAPTEQRAETEAHRRGWILVGELVDRDDCPPDIAAMVELRLHGHTVH